MDGSTREALRSAISRARLAEAAAGSPRGRGKTKLERAQPPSPADGANTSDPAIVWPAVRRALGRLDGPADKKA